MLSLMKEMLGPSTSYQDKIMYLTSLGVNHSIGSDKNSKNSTCVERILDLITSSDTRYLGLQLLELALQQNSDNIYNKGRWVIITYNIIKDSRAASVEKVQACKVLSLMIPYMSIDPFFDTAREELIRDIYPVLLQEIDENSEWAEEACICVLICLKNFPSHLAAYQSSLLNVILHQTSYNVSSKSFEVLAECFCELPRTCRDNNAEVIQERFKELYSRTLKTIETLQITCLSYMSSNEPYDKIDVEFSEFIFKEESDDSNFYSAFVKCVRRFVNLCRLLAKLLSVGYKYPVQVPVIPTIMCLCPIYASCKKEKLVSAEEEALYTFITQMRLAGLAVLESLTLNFNLLKHTELMRDIIQLSVESSHTPISSELVSELRIASWKLMCTWLNGFGRCISKEVSGTSQLIQELLQDINIDIDDGESIQASNAMQAHSKSKKNISSDSSNKSVLKRKSQQKVCEAALDALDSLLCTGTLDFPKGVFEEVCKRVFKICHTIHSSSDPFPFPYNDESCRLKLYTVVLTIIIVLKSDEFQLLQTAVKILSHISRDPSFQVRKLYNKATVILRLQLYPKRPLPVYSENNQRRQNVSNEIAKYAEWSSQEFVQNLKVEKVSETPENVNITIEQSFPSENEVEVHSEECMEVETHYPEQVVENQCNGEDILEIQSSSQCQDDVDSDDEEEEEDEERSFGDEEINQEEPIQEIYIPTTRKVQNSPPLQINSETVHSITEPEYEELTPCIKTEENDLSNSNKDKCVNGENDSMHDEDMPSSSTQVTNENGIFGIDDDDLDEENEEEEEEENESYSSEKKLESYDPPSKRQKFETTDDLEEDVKNDVKSPSLEDMKADCIDMITATEDDAISGKVQLSTS